MRLILFPREGKWTNLPEGITHSEGMRCPFEGFSHPRGSTCCSFDATQAQEVLREHLGKGLAELIGKDWNCEEALDIGLELREWYVNAMAFHCGYRERNGAWPEHPMTAAWEKARARGEKFPDGSFDEFIEAFRSIGHASEWLIAIGKRHFAVHAVHSPFERE